MSSLKFRSTHRSFMCNFNMFVSTRYRSFKLDMVLVKFLMSARGVGIVTFLLIYSDVNT
jgi:hypothetical protein